LLPNFIEYCKRLVADRGADSARFMRSLHCTLRTLLARDLSAHDWEGAMAN